MDLTQEDQHLNDLYHEIKERLVERDMTHVTPTGQAVVLMRIAIENGGDELGMMGIMHVLSNLMTQTLGIMSDAEDGVPISSDAEEDIRNILRNLNTDSIN